jgi:long-chain acyl-CoA synthetase
MNRNFWDYKEDYSDNIFLIDPENDVSLTYKKTYELADKVTNAIAGGKKKLAFLFCRNDFITVTEYIALLRSGHALLLLDNKLNEEIRSNLINIYKPEIIFSPEEVTNTGYTRDDIDEKYFYYTHISHRTDDIYPDLAVLLSTSGTTGSPKLVRLSYKNIRSNASSIAEYLKITEDQRSITSLPMSYSFGLSVINSYLLSGGSLLLTDGSFVLRDFWNHFNKYECTSFSGVPYSYELLKKTNFEKMELPSLKVMTQAGGRLSNDLIKYFSKLSEQRGFSFYVMYGQTEATARISYVPPSELPEKTGSIGIAIPGGEISIHSGGKEVSEADVEGELVYKGDNVMLGYAEERDDLSKGDELNGKLHTGDIAYKDQDNFFYITGRLKRFIKIFGLRLNLDEVEKMIESQYKIFNACSGTDDRLNILIDSSDGVSSEDIRQKVAAYYKIKKSLITVLLADKMPVTESGKKDYKAISRLF